MSHYIILCAATEGAPLGDASWLAVFDAIKEYVFVSACDAECHDSAMLLLRRFTSASPDAVRALKSQALLGSIVLMHTSPAFAPYLGPLGEFLGEVRARACVWLWLCVCVFVCVCGCACVSVCVCIYICMVCALWD